MRWLFVVGVVLVLVVFSGCSRLFPWVSVRDGVEFYGESVVRVDGVEVWVSDFGVWNSWGNPQVKIEVRNNWNKHVTFEPVKCWLEVEDKRVWPDLRVKNSTEKYAVMDLKWGEKAKVTIPFHGMLRLENMNNPVGKRSRVIPEILILHLPPLVIDGIPHEMPILSFKNPGS